MSASRRSRSGEDPSRAIWERRQREKEQVRARIENERKQIKAMSQYGKLRKQAEWKRKLSASPFAVDQLAEHERIDEENRVRLVEEQRRQKQMEKRKEAIKTQIIVKALSEASDIESLRAEKRAIQQEERRLKALLEIERVKQHRKADHQAAVRAEQVRHREKKEFRKDKFSVLQQQRQNTLREAKMAREGLVDDPTTGRAVAIMSKEGQYAVQFLRKAGRLPPYVDRYIAMRREREVAIDPALGPVRMPPSVADRATGQAIAAEMQQGLMAGDGPGYGSGYGAPGPMVGGAGIAGAGSGTRRAGGAASAGAYGSGYAGGEGGAGGPDGGYFDAAALAAGGGGLGPGLADVDQVYREGDGSGYGPGDGVGSEAGSSRYRGAGGSRSGPLEAAVEEEDEEDEDEEEGYEDDDFEGSPRPGTRGGSSGAGGVEGEAGGGGQVLEGAVGGRASSPVGSSGGGKEEGDDVYGDDEFELSQTGNGLPSRGGNGGGSDEGMDEALQGSAEGGEDEYEDDFDGQAP